MKLDRRSFLSVGALAAVLPPSLRGGGDGPAAPNATGPARALGGPLANAHSPLLKAVKFTQLSIAVGAHEPFRAVHCSDTHLNFMTVGDLLGASEAIDLPMYEKRRTQHNALAPFAACVLKARLEKMPLLHTGDVWDYDSAANMLIAQDAFVQAQDVFYAMGNHEMKGHWRTPADYSAPAWRTRIQPYLPNSVLCAAKVMHGVNFVSFDDTGYSFDRQAELEAFVKAEFARGMPVVLMVHEPFLTDELFADLIEAKGPMVGHKKVEPKNLSGHVYGAKPHERDFIGWLVRQQNLKAVLCGHLHLEAQYRLSDTVTQYIAGAAMKGCAYELEFT